MALTRGRAAIGDRLHVRARRRVVAGSRCGPYCHRAGNRVLRRRWTRDGVIWLRHRVREQLLLCNRSGNRLRPRSYPVGDWLRGGYRQEPARLRRGACEQLLLR
jgi:hypothetical protein